MRVRRIDFLILKTNKRRIVWRDYPPPPPNFPPPPPPPPLWLAGVCYRSVHSLENAVADGAAYVVHHHVERHRAQKVPVCMCTMASQCVCARVM